MTTKELLDKLASQVYKFRKRGDIGYEKELFTQKLNHESDKTKMEPNFNQGNPQLAMNFPNWNLILQ